MMMLMARGCTKTTTTTADSLFSFLSTKRFLFIFFAFGIALLFSLYFILDNNVFWLYGRSSTIRWTGEAVKCAKVVSRRASLIQKRLKVQGNQSFFFFAETLRERTICCLRLAGKLKTPQFNSWSTAFDSLCLSLAIERVREEEKWFNVERLIATLLISDVLEWLVLHFFSSTPWIKQENMLDDLVLSKAGKKNNTTIYNFISFSSSWLAKWAESK